MPISTPRKFTSQAFPKTSSMLFFQFTFLLQEEINRKNNILIYLMSYLKPSMWFMDNHETDIHNFIFQPFTLKKKYFHIPSVVSTKCFRIPSHVALLSFSWILTFILLLRSSISMARVHLWSACVPAQYSLPLGSFKQKSLNFPQYPIYKSLLQKICVCWDHLLFLIPSNHVFFFCTCSNHFLLCKISPSRIPSFMYGFPNCSSVNTAENITFTPTTTIHAI